MSALYHQDPLPVLTKVCSRCHIRKSIDQFGPDKRATLGVRPECNQCRKAESHAYYVKRYGLKREPLPKAVNGGKVCIRCRIEKPFEQFAQTSRPKDSRDGRVAQCKQCMKEVQELNHTPEEVKARYQRNVARNGDQYRATAREWKRNHPLEVREMNARREAMKKAAQVEDNIDYIHILERDNGWCYICCKEILEGDRIAFDHVIPLIPRKGTNREPGVHAESNIKLTHYLCNARKGNKLLEEMDVHERRGIRFHTAQFPSKNE